MAKQETRHVWHIKQYLFTKFEGYGCTPIYLLSKASGILDTHRDIEADDRLIKHCVKNGMITFTSIKRFENLKNRFLAFLNCYESTRINQS